MTTDAKWQTATIAGLDFDALFNCGRFPSARTQPEPNHDDPARALANIRAWREYLPEACVAAMISDGWHLST